MKSINKRSFLPTILLVGMLILATLSFWQMRSAQAAVNKLAGETAQCRQLAEQILSMQELPKFAVLEADSPQSTADRIQRAIAEAKLPTQALLRIQPQSPFRIGTSRYQMRPTRLELRNVELADVIAFAHHLNEADQGLVVRDLRLWTNELETSAQERWSVEITLTQLVFSPTIR